MNISSYKTLISNLPVRQQCFTTKRTTWKTVENEIEWLNTVNESLFGNNQTLIINRQDIFETTDIRELIIKTIYWGYTGGMRGSHFVNILRQIDLIEDTLENLKQIAKPTTEDFNQLMTIFKNVRGLGLSTYSKLLYFSQITFNDTPCLILDQRLIDVFRSKIFLEFDSLNRIRYDNAEKRYLEYMLLTNELSNQLEAKGENIEQFLFIFGNNLKI